MGTCYDGALIMPSSYAVMDEEEMTYFNGGVSIPNWLAGGVINLAIDCLVVGGARKAAKFFSQRVKKYGARTTGLWFSQTLRKKMIAKGIASAAASGICNIAAACITVLSWAVDPGGSLASAIDGRDKRPRNGYIDI